MADANPDVVVRREFPDKPRPADLGDPARDRPFTVRVRDGVDWRTRNFDRAAVRAIRTTLTGPLTWIIVAGPDKAVGRMLADDAVRTWPVAHPPMTSAPWFAPDAEPSPAQAAERGDMGVEAFRGGES